MYVYVCVLVKTRNIQIDSDKLTDVFYKIFLPPMHPATKSRAIVDGRKFFQARAVMKPPVEKSTDVI